MIKAVSVIPYAPPLFLTIGKTGGKETRNKPSIAASAL